jgi:hypothetical protein
MLDPGISVQYGTSGSWWGPIIAGTCSAAIAAGAAILSAFLVNMHQTQLQDDVNRHQTRLQDTRLQAEETRARMDAQRVHGEELYRLFVEWLEKMLNDTSELVHKHARKEVLTAEDARVTIGDTAKYQRIILLAHLDFPVVKEVMGEIAVILNEMRSASAKITTEQLRSEAITTISTEHLKLSLSGDSFQVVLLNAIKDIYGDNEDVIHEAPIRLPMFFLSTSGQ